MCTRGTYNPVGGSKWQPRPKPTDLTLSIRRKADIPMDRQKSMHRRNSSHTLRTIYDFVERELAWDLLVCTDYRISTPVKPSALKIRVEVGLEFVE